MGFFTNHDILYIKQYNINKISRVIYNGHELQFYDIFLLVWDIQHTAACLYNFLARKEPEDLTAKDLGYLILGPGHICAVC